MSVYTEAEHAIAITDTLKWIDHPPKSPEERYSYGRYHQRLKDFNAACHYYAAAIADNILEAWFDLGECLRLSLIDTDHFPDSDVLPSVEECYKNAWQYYKALLTPSDEAIFRMGLMLKYGLGTLCDFEKSKQYFQQIIDNHSDLTPEHFNITCDYSVEGSIVAAPTDFCKLPVGSALYELALMTDDGDGRRQLLKKAYAFHCEDALFYDFEHFEKGYDTYEWQDDIRELFSFRIGQYGRVCDIHPSRKAYERLALMYENGYPGDEGERKEVFARKALPIRKKMVSENKS